MLNEKIRSVTLSINLCVRVKEWNYNAMYRSGDGKRRADNLPTIWLMRNMEKAFFFFMEFFSVFCFLFFFFAFMYKIGALLYHANGTCVRCLRVCFCVCETQVKSFLCTLKGKRQFKLISHLTNRWHGAADLMCGRCSCRCSYWRWHCTDTAAGAGCKTWYCAIEIC